MSEHPLPPRDVERTAELVRALDSELRLNILLLLESSDRVVHEMVQKLGKSQPLISQHLRVLKVAGLVSAHRNGREVSYSLERPEIIDVIFRLAALSASGELDEQRITALLAERDLPTAGTTSNASIIDPPASARPPTDPGLAPHTPRPQRGS